MLPITWALGFTKCMEMGDVLMNSCNRICILHNVTIKAGHYTTSCRFCGTLFTLSMVIIKK